MSAVPGRAAIVHRLRRVLGRRPAERIRETECATRAAVTLVLRPPSAPDREPEALFVRRARVKGDPWSGHVALPGGRSEEDDADLLETALRETREETGLRLARTDHLGRLGEIHPRSPHLPAICVTPFVAWLAEEQEVQLNHELVDHVWIPLDVLSDPAHRFIFVPDSPTRSEFPAIRHGEHVIWGLTFAILEDFIGVLAAASEPDA